MFNTPILFIVFNRPDTTQQVFNKIREQQPAKLYITSDGPRLNNETDKLNCERVKAILDNIDWPCDVKRLYAEENLGFSIRIKSALQWFFENEEMGIILEDDCLPAVSFFKFCEILLEKYQEDTQVAMIGGTAFYNKRISSKYNFFSGDFMYTWGFATWKRVWSDIDFYKKIDLAEAESNLMQRYDNNELYVRYHLDILKNAQKEPIVYWDYSFFIHNLKKGMVGIIPSINLVSNIGNTGTHFVNSNSMLLNTQIEELEIGEDFQDTGSSLTPSQKKKIMKTIIQKIYPVGWRNRLYFIKAKVMKMFGK